MLLDYNRVRRDFVWLVRLGTMVQPDSRSRPPSMVMMQSPFRQMHAPTAGDRRRLDLDFSHSSAKPRFRRGVEKV